MDEPEHAASVTPMHIYKPTLSIPLLAVCLVQWWIYPTRIGYALSLVAMIGLGWLGWTKPWRPRKTGLLLLILLLGATPARATVIDFTQPEAFGLIAGSGLTVTGLDLTGQPLPVQTAAGVGLGLHDGRVTRGVTYRGTGVIPGMNGLIDLQVAGVFTRLILQPFFEVIGGPPPAGTQVIELSLGAGPMAGQAVGGYFVNAFAPISLEPPLSAGIDRFQVGLRADFGPDPWLSQYLDMYGRPQAITWGFSIRAVEWQPSPVSTPEPGLLGLVGLGLVWTRRRS
jgi:MYXO-CTERM domain-containing protein